MKGRQFMDREIVNNIKSLAIDMIDKAGSGHPGIALGSAPILYTLYAKHMNIIANEPKFENRDLFVLSAGHGSALLYATLYMAGFDISLDDLKNFRRINSKTPGHPEIKTPGVDCSTGLLGQGIATAVGMALASKLKNKKYTMPKKSKLGKDQSLFDNYVYVLCSDGDLMEGISYEATSLAGTLKLNNLIVLYDSNNITLDGSKDNTFTENVIDRFKALNWNTILVKDGNSISSIDKAIIEAKKSDLPTLIEIKTVIGNGSINENTNIVHGNPLNKDDITKLKIKLNVNPEEFYVNKKAKENFSKQIYTRSIKKFDLFNKQCKNLNYNNEYKINLKDITHPLNESLRDSNNRILHEIEKQLPNFIGGSADVATSTKAYLNNNITDFVGNNIIFGVRENSMGAILNGLALCNYVPFGSTFLAFSDYMKPSIRMSAFMNLNVTYLFTHDSINIGQDGPTHQPIEQLSMLRSIPNMNVFRPCDAKELCGCWEYIINNHKPSCLILSRNEVKLCENSTNDVSCGGYIIRKEINKLHAIIVATGSEVATCIEIANYLYDKYKVDIRVISMPCRELYLNQSDEYKESIIPKGYRTIVVETGCKYGWESFVYDDKYLITTDKFGFSGTTEEVLDEFGFSYKILLEKIINLLK